MSFSSPSSSSHRENNTLSEVLVQDAFHHLLQDALIQARTEGLISKEEIARHDTDIQIIASSLALYFAALTARGNPPYISFPNDENMQLSQENCPASFASFFHLWQASVAKIQRLSLEYRHDLALLLCEREPMSSPIRMQVANLARDLKSVALDIVQVGNFSPLFERVKGDLFFYFLRPLQRSTFQNQFKTDVQTAINASLNGNYMAPPSTPPSVSSSSSSKHQQQQNNDKPLPLPALAPRNNSYRSLPPPPLPTIAVEPPEGETSALMLIRETLFAALGDCLATNQDLLCLIGRGQDNKSWSSRCFFASLCLSILDVCLFRIQLPPSDDAKHLNFAIAKKTFPWQDAFVRTVHDSMGNNKISLTNCPGDLSKLLMVLFQIGMFVQSLSEADDMKAMQDAAEDRVSNEDDLYIWRLKRKLLGDVAAQSQHIDQSIEDYVKDAAVMINRLALGESSARAMAVIYLPVSFSQQCLKYLHFVNDKQKPFQY